jgi:HAD superfamily hydrolase (TIGR01484 family)
VIVHVLACDYDGTIATDGRVSEETFAALGRVRESGRRLVLVTGRMLDDLRAAFSAADQLFDAVVAENGAVLYFPPSREERVLGDPPEPVLLEALERHGVTFVVGRSIVASGEAFAEPAIAAIRDAGVERTLVFNKGALMLLPGGVTKATGLEAALAGLGLSPRNTIGIGDAENDHAFLASCECAVAVADAVPALRERADLVTAGPSALGVVELIQTHVLADGVDLLPRLARHRITLGEQADGTPVTIAAHRTRLLVVGPSARGRSALTGLLVDRLLEAGRAVCVLDPGGGYRRLAELEGVVVLGGTAERALPAGEELGQLVSHPRTSLVLDLSALTRAGKVRYATKALAAITAARARCGVPHWLVVGEVPDVAPRDGSPAGEWLRLGNESLCLVVQSAGDLKADMRGLATVVASTEGSAIGLALGTLLDQAAPAGAPPGGSLKPGEAELIDLGASEVRVERFRVGRGRLARRPRVR